MLAQDVDRTNKEMVTLYLSTQVKNRPKMTKRNAIQSSDYLTPRKSLERIVDTDEDGTTITTGYVLTDGNDIYALDIGTLRSLLTYPGFNKGRSTLRTTFPIVEVARAMSARHDEDMRQNSKDPEFDKMEMEMLLSAFVLPGDDEEAELMAKWPRDKTYQHPKPLDQ